MNPGDTPSDHSLLRRFRSGNEDAATALYLRYAARIRALVQARCSGSLTRRIDPDDIVQSVFRRFFQKVKQGDYDVPAGEELWKLLLVIALNRLSTEEVYHRAHKRDVRLTAGNESLDACATNVRSDEVAYQVLQITIDDMLERLPAGQRDMVVLRIEGHGIEDIARQTGRSKRSVERCLQSIRARMHTLLDR